MTRYDRGILVTGGGTFLGDNIAAALLAEGAEVSILVRSGAEDQLGPLAHHTRWSTADVWNPASLRGQARYHSAVIHTVGSLHADPAQGLSYERLNFVTARNVANMCVSDGVEHMILISAASAPWTKRPYIRSKREAERYLRRLGLKFSIVRSPLLYVRGHPRPLLYRASTILSSIPPLSLLPFGRIGPIAIDVFARGVARLAMSPDYTKSVYYARDMRRLNTREEIRRASDAAGTFLPKRTQNTDLPIAAEEDMPFAWIPEDEG